MAAGTVQMLRTASLKSTALPASLQPSEKLTAYSFTSFFIPALLGSDAEMLKANRQIEEVHFSSAPERCYLETVFSYAFQATPYGARLLCELSVGQWVAMGTVSKQLSSPIIREGKGKHKHTQVDIQNKVEI